MPQTSSAPNLASTDRASTGVESMPPNDPRSIRRRLRLLPIVGTFLVAIIGLGAVWILWQNYMATPWTRDGTVRAYVVTLAPEVSGRVAELAVKDNQFVHKGDLLMRIDPRDYKVAVDLSNAAVDEAQAEVEQQKANLERAQINLERTEIRVPVSGWITNLLVRQGDYATTGQTAMSIVDADSFWVDGYFEETALRNIEAGDPAKIWLLGYGRMLQGRVDSVARGIVVLNATPGKSGLASVNPIFTWVRLAQRIPVRIQIDQVPPDVRLVVGMTATIEVEPGLQSSKGTSERPLTTSTSKP